MLSCIAPLFFFTVSGFISIVILLPVPRLCAYMYFLVVLLFLCQLSSCCLSHYYQVSYSLFLFFNILWSIENMYCGCTSHFHFITMIIITAMLCQSFLWIYLYPPVCTSVCLSIYSLPSLCSFPYFAIYSRNQQVFFKYSCTYFSVLTLLVQGFVIIFLFINTCTWYIVGVLVAIDIFWGFSL